MEINKESMLEAISQYDGYTKKQREVFKTLLKMSINNMAVVMPETISSVTSVSMPVVYATLNLLQKQGIISLVKDDKGKVVKFKYLINPEQFPDIFERVRVINSLKNK